MLTGQPLKYVSLYGMECAPTQLTRAFEENGSTSVDVHFPRYQNYRLPEVSISQLQTRIKQCRDIFRTESR